MAGYNRVLSDALRLLADRADRKVAS